MNVPKMPWLPILVVTLLLNTLYVYTKDGMEIGGGGVVVSLGLTVLNPLVNRGFNSGKKCTESIIYKLEGNVTIVMTD
jgi:hypothetical protein